MKPIEFLSRAMLSLAFAAAALASVAADYPAPQEGSWVGRDFRFHTGEVLPELRLHYRTVGAPGGQPIVLRTARRSRPRQIEQALRRPARALPALQLRRHGGRLAAPGDRAPGRAPRAAGDRQLDGRHGDLDLGAEISGLHGRRGA